MTKNGLARNLGGGYPYVMASNHERTWEATRMNWEYKTVQLKAKGVMGGLIDQEEFEASLNELGARGWELVNVFDTNYGYGTTRLIVAVFKRPRG
jgi:hypothetical protein